MKTKNFYTFLLQISIILIISKINLTNSTLVGEIKSLLSFGQEFKSELSSIQQTPWSFNKLDYQNYTFSDATLGRITLSNFKLFLTRLNVDYLNIKLDQLGGFSLSDDNKSGTFYNILNFTYEYLGKKTDSNFKLVSANLKFIKNFLTEDYLIKQKVLTELNLKITDIEVNDEALKKLLTLALNDFLINKVNSLVKAAIDSDIVSFYDTLSKKKTTLKLIGFSPKLEFNFDFSYDKAPLVISSDKAQNLMFSRKGLVNGITHNDSSPEFKYDLKDDISQITISRELFKDVINQMTLNGLFDFSINLNNLCPEADFDLTINSLANVIPDITDIFIRTQKIKIYNVVKSIDFDKIYEDKFIFKVDVETQIFETNNESVIFKFSHVLSLELKPFVSDTNLNFYFDSVSLESLKVISNEYLLVNTQVLQGFAKNYYELYFALNKRFYLFEKPIDMSYYTESIRKAEFTSYGVNLLVDYKTAGFVKKEVKEAIKFLEDI